MTRPRWSDGADALAGRPLTLAYAAPEQVLEATDHGGGRYLCARRDAVRVATGSRLYRATEPRALEAEILRGDLRRPSEAAQDKERAKALRGDLDAISDCAQARAR